MLARAAIALATERDVSGPEPDASGQDKPEPDPSGPEPQDHGRTDGNWADEQP